MLDVIRANAQSWGVKIAFGIIILVFVFWGVGSFSGGPSTVALTVNKEPITIQEYQAQYEMFERQLRSQMPGLDADTLKSMQINRRVIQQMVIQALIQQEANRAGIVVTPQELRQFVEEIPAFHDAQGHFDPNRYVNILKAQQDSPGHFEARLSDEMLMGKMQRQVTAGLSVSESEVKDLYLYEGERRTVDYVLFPLEDYKDKVNISEADIKTWYEANQTSFQIPDQADIDYLLVGAETLAPAQTITDAAIQTYYDQHPDHFVHPERVRASHILLPLAEDAPQEEVEKRQSEIKDLEKNLHSGADFAELAKKYSKDPGSAAQGGDLGWFTRQQMVQPFAEAAFALKLGEISQPVRTQFGLHLIKMEAHEAESKESLESVKESIQNRLATEQAAGQVQDALEQIQLALIGGKDLATAGEPFKLQVTNTGLKNRAELTSLLGIKKENMDTLLASTPGTPLDTPFVSRKGYVLATVKKLQPASVKPLEEVSSEIKARLEKEQALHLAMQAAETICKDMHQTLPENLKSKILKSEPMTRNGILPGLNEETQATAEFGKAVFDAKQGAWLSAPYALDKGAALLRVAEILRPSEEEWSAASEQLQNAVLNARRQQMFQAFLNMLRTNAVVEIKNQRILQDDNG